MIHPTAHVASTAALGAGCIIGPFASVGSNARLGEHVLLNLYAAAGHDTQIGSCSVLSPYGIANGGSVIEERVFFGTHAVVTPNKKVGRQSRIAAGAVVYRDVPELSLAGNPAKTFPVSQTGNSDLRQFQSFLPSTDSSLSTRSERGSNKWARVRTQRARPVPSA